MGLQADCSWLRKESLSLRTSQYKSSKLKSKTNKDCPKKDYPRTITCLVAQSCLTLCNPMNQLLSMGILQARILEWVAMSSSRRSSQPRDWTRVSYVSCVSRRVLHHQHHLVVAGCWHSGKKKVYLLEKKKKGLKKWVKKENRLIRSYFLPFPHLQSRESAGETCG